MSSHATTLKLYETAIGKKAVMAVSGPLLFAFLVAHMIGNLQVFAGPQKLDAYAAWLHAHPALVWPMRGGLLAILGLHVLFGLQVWLANRRARPQRYARYAPRAAGISSRTMIYGGVAIFAFVLYHLLHLTWGTAHQRFVPGAVYCNVVLGFRVWWATAIYGVAMVFIGLHLFHGLWSFFQTLGLNSPTWDGRLRKLAGFASVLVVLGDLSMPIAALAGLLPVQGICS